MPTADTYARFYIHPVLTEGKRGTSTAVFDDVLYTQIFVKGSQNTSFSRPKKDEDESMFAAEWNAYRNNEEYEVKGTNLSVLPTVGPSAIMNLNAQGISTVEDLAGLSDSVVLGERGMVGLRQRAQAYLEALNPEIAAQREADDNAKDAIIEELQAKMAAIEANQTPKRTRRKRNPETGELE